MPSTGILPAGSNYFTDNNGYRIDSGWYNANARTHGPVAHDTGLHGPAGQDPRSYSEPKMNSGAAGFGASAPSTGVAPAAAVSAPALGPGTYRTTMVASVGGRVMNIPLTVTIGDTVTVDGIPGLDGAQALFRSAGSFAAVKKVAQETISCVVDPKKETVKLVGRSHTNPSTVTLYGEAKLRPGSA